MRKELLRSREGRTPVPFFHRVTKLTRFWGLGLVPVIVVITLLFLAGGTGQPRYALNVDLEDKSEISPVQQIGAGISDQSGDNSLRVAIAGVLSPSMTLQYYQELLAYMERRLGRHVTLIQKPTYAEINDLIRGQRVDVAFICSLAYVKGKDDFNMELLVVPQMYGETVYYSYLIVPAGSSVTRLEDLRDANFAFTDPLSNSGYLAPTYYLSLSNEAPISFFSRYIFTYSHDNSIMAVADKLVDGAAVDSLVYNQLVANNAELASEVRIIARWGPFGIPPVVSSPALDSQLKRQLQDFFLDLHQSDEGAMILNNLAIDKFVIVPDDLYNSIRDMKAKVGW